MKKPIFIGLIGGTILTFTGWLSLIGGSFAVECSGKQNPFIGLGNVLLFPASPLANLIAQYGILSFVAVAIGIVIQLIWYIALAVLISKIFKRKSEPPH